MQILALDVGKSKSVAYAVDPDTGECGFTAVRTRPSALGRLFVRHRGAHLVTEIGPMAGCISDLARTAGLRRAQVAHVGPPAWRWRNVRRAPTPRQGPLLAAAVQAVRSIGQKTGHSYLALTERQDALASRRGGPYTVASANAQGQGRTPCRTIPPCRTST